MLVWEPLPMRRFEIGIWASLSSIALTLCTLFDLYTPAVRKKDDMSRIHVSGGVAVAQLVFGLLTATVCLLIPRRPKVDRNGRVVDAQYTGSALGRLEICTNVFSSK